MGIVLPVSLVIFGAITGGATAYLLKPDLPLETDGTLKASIVETEAKADGKPTTPSAFVKLNNQFVVPILNERFVSGLVVLSITLEASPDDTSQLYNIEPKIRDTVLQVLFDHAYIGGFDGKFTSPTKMIPLRKSLLAAVNEVSGDVVRDILITDIIRQDS